MFGIIRPCRNRLGDELRAAWLAHLCGMCLALRDRHGHLSRLVTNYDAIVISVLVEAQRPGVGGRRRAGPCALRGLRPAPVTTGESAELAASVSLLLAAAKLDDHVEDGDVTGRLRTRATARLADRWREAGTATGDALALDTRRLLDTVSRQASIEDRARTVLEVTGPAEAATAQAFAHTAVVAGQPANVAPLAEAGRLFGRLAHLLDAVADRHDDDRHDRWNPITAFALPPVQVRALCDDAVLGIRLALSDATFTDARLVHQLLAHEPGEAVRRIFVEAGQPPTAPPPPGTPVPPGSPAPGSPAPGSPAPGSPAPEQPGWEAPPPAPPKRAPLGACLGWLVVCGTCQVCCADEWTNPSTGKKHGGCLPDLCCDCGDCCDC